MLAPEAPPPGSDRRFLPSAALLLSVPDDVPSAVALSSVVPVAIVSSAGRGRGAFKKTALRKKRDRAWFLCTEEYFNVKCFLQKKRFFRKIIPMEIRAHRSVLQNACHDLLSGHPPRVAPSSPAVLEEDVPRGALPVSRRAHVNDAGHPVGAEGLPFCVSSATVAPTFDHRGNHFP